MPPPSAQTRQLYRMKFAEIVKQTGKPAHEVLDMAGRLELSAFEKALGEEEAYKKACDGVIHVLTTRLPVMRQQQNAVAQEALRQQQQLLAANLRPVPVVQAQPQPPPVAVQQPQQVPAPVPAAAPIAQNVPQGAPVRPRAPPAAAPDQPQAHPPPQQPAAPAAPVQRPQQPQAQPPPQGNAAGVRPAAPQVAQVAAAGRAAVQSRSPANAVRPPNARTPSAATPASTTSPAATGSPTPAAGASVKEGGKLAPHAHAAKESAFFERLGIMREMYADELRVSMEGAKDQSMVKRMAKIEQLLKVMPGQKTNLTVAKNLNMGNLAMIDASLAGEYPHAVVRYVLKHSDAAAGHVAAVAASALASCYEGPSWAAAPSPTPAKPWLSSPANNGKSEVALGKRKRESDESDDDDGDWVGGRARKLSLPLAARHELDRVGVYGGWTVRSIEREYDGVSVAWVVWIVRVADSGTFTASLRIPVDYPVSSARLDMGALHSQEMRRVAACVRGYVAQYPPPYTVTRLMIALNDAYDRAQECLPRYVS